ncbi:MAG: hypothetical protein ACLFQB_06740 [Chitinispirillaceae bacterium]
MRKITIIVIFAVIYAKAAFLEVSGNSCRDIQLAVNKCRNLDTVRIPPGVYEFSAAISMPKGITVMGAGKDETIFRRSDTSEGEFWFFRIDGSHRFPFRISAISFEGSHSKTTSGIFIEHGALDFRIDNCRFECLTRRAIEIRDGGRGVIDQNIFMDNFPTAVVVYGRGHEEWKAGLSLGTREAIFVEDNFFSQENVPDKHRVHHIASNNGSKYVFRFNTIQDGKMASHSIDAHGNKFGWERGSRSYEIYGNTVTAVHRWAGINIRGGDGVIFNNRFKGSFVSPIHLMHEGKNGNGNCNYPCEDQIRELYIWNNTYNGQDVQLFVRHEDILRENRDYWKSKRPGYEPYVYPHPLRECKEKEGDM